MGEIFKFGPEHLKKVENPKWDKSKEFQEIDMDIYPEPTPEDLEEDEKHEEAKIVPLNDNKEETTE